MQQANVSVKKDIQEVDAIDVKRVILGSRIAPNVYVMKLVLLVKSAVLMVDVYANKTMED